MIILLLFPILFDLDEHVSGVATTFAFLVV